MTPPFVRPRALDIVSGVFVLAAISFVARRGIDPVTPRPPAMNALSNASAAVVHVDSSSSLLVARNVFSATRRAPTTRFTPPGTELGVPSAVSVAAMPSTMASDSLNIATSTQLDAAPHLYGIVTEDGVRRALLLLSARGGVPRLFAVGEGSGGFRVVSVVADRVILASASGVRTLRLVSRASRDSLENLP